MSKIDVSQWGEFRVGDLFEKISTKKVPFKALDLPQTPNSIQDLPLVAAGVDNQGRNRYVDPSCATILSNCLTVSANGANSGAVFYQDSNFSILQDAYALQLVDMYKKHRIQNIYLFLASVLTNVLVNNDWINKATWQKVQNKEIYLPITPDGEPDWEYMDNYIVKLAARAHKDVSSLNRVKSKPHKINIDNWQKFKIGDVFEKLTTKSYIRHQLKSDLATSKSAEFSLPLVYAKYDNNGIMYYDKPDNHESHGHCLSVIYNGAVSAGLVFPQVSPVGVWAEAYLLRCKYDIDDACLFYLAAVLQRVTYYKYSRDDLSVWSKVKYDYIFLPVTSSGQPDFDYMKNYIEMMQASVKCRLQSYQNLDN